MYSGTCHLMNPRLWLIVLFSSLGTWHITFKFSSINRKIHWFSSLTIQPSLLYPQNYDYPLSLWAPQKGRYSSFFILTGTFPQTFLGSCHGIQRMDSNYHLGSKIRGDLAWMWPAPIFSIILWTFEPLPSLCFGPFATHGGRESWYQLWDPPFSLPSFSENSKTWLIF